MSRFTARSTSSLDWRRTGYKQTIPGKRRRVKEDMSYEDGAVEVSRSVRDVQPAHYLFKIEFFSILLEEKIESYQSDDFEAGGYKWGLCLYPNGNKERDGKGHISLYLVIRGTDYFPRGWEVNVQFKLFVFDQIRNKYLTIQDAEGKIRRFHGRKTEWGFAQLLPLDSFNSTSNGYLLDDSCVFGAEVFVIKYAGKGECVSMIQKPKNNTFTWKVDNFSALTEISLRSEEFIVGERKWKLLLYPRRGFNLESLSLFLVVTGCETFPRNWKFYAKYKLRIRDQILSRHFEREARCWFSALIKDWGYWDFKKLCDLNDKSNGFIVKDTLIVEVEIMVMSVVKNVSK